MKRLEVEDLAKAIKGHILKYQTHPYIKSRLHLLILVVFFFSFLNDISGQIQIVSVNYSSIGNSQDIFCGYSTSRSYRVVNPSGLNYSKIEWTASPTTISITPSTTDSSLIAIGWTNQVNPITASLIVTDTSSISVADTIDVTINPVPNVSLSLNNTTFQRCSAPVTLSGGVPSGGSYSISGYPNAINSLGQIDPSELPVGNHTVTYSYTNIYGCSSTANQSISISGFILNGPGVNLLVSSVSNSISTPILGSTINGITTYSLCGSLANATFQLSPLSGLSNFVSYSVDWGDGSSTQSAAISTTSPIAHQFNTAGLYSVTLELFTSNGCSIVTDFNIFFGASQILGLVADTVKIACLLPGQDSVSFLFELTNWLNDPSGITYLFSSNDLSPTRTAYSPLVLAGVSQYPFLVYDSINQKLFYEKYFHQSSCSYNTANFNNTFSVTATKASPCPGSQNTVTQEPFNISESPRAKISGPDSTCTNTYVTILNNSTNGIMIVNDAAGTNRLCDSTSSGYWEILDDNGNVIPQSAGVFTLSAASSLGSYGAFPSIPGYWTSGSSNISIKFNLAGSYTIIKHIGLTGVGGSSLCTLGIDSHSICVDTIPFLFIAANIPDTICNGTTISMAFHKDSINCNSPTNYILEVFDSTYSSTVYQNSSTTDTNFSWTSTLPGKYILKYTVQNQCGSNYSVDTVFIEDTPDVSFPPNDTIYCANSKIISFGHYPFSLVPSNTFNTLDSIVYSISPQSGWTYLGTNIFGFDSLELNTFQSYTFQGIAYDECGSKTAVTSITLDSIPNPTFNLVSLDGCSPFIPSINQFYTHPDKSHTWIVYDSNNNVIQQLAGLTPTFTALTNTSNTNDSTYTIKHIVETASGCKDSLTLTLTVLPNPEANFTVSNADCAPWTPAFTNNTIGNNLTYLWSIDHIGTFTSLATLSDTNNLTPSLSFSGLQYPSLDQQYFITLVATSDSGCTDSFADTLKLYARPLADFILPVDSACGPYSFSPTDASGSNSNISSWNWTLTDSVGVLITTSTLPNPTFSLPQSFNGIATYSLQLIVTDDRSCSDTTTQNVYINPTPSADFTLSDSTCTGVNLNTLLVNNSNSNLSYNWNLDSAGISILTSTDPIPSFILNNNDTTTFFYTLSLTVTNNYGCDSTVFDSIAIHPNAIAQFNTTGPIVDCAPLLIDTSLFVANHFSGNGIYNWRVDSSGITIYSSTGRNAINYNLASVTTALTVHLNISSSFGCDSDSASIAVSTTENPNSFWSLDTVQGCAPLLPNIDSVTADATLSHTWIVYDSNNNVIQQLAGLTPTFTALTNTSNTNDSTYTIKHIVETASGCKDSLTLTLTVLPNPEANFTVSNADCAPWTPAFTNNTIGNNLTYLWSIDHIGTFTSLATLSDTNNLTPSLSFSGLQYPSLDQQYFITLVATSDSGCTDSFADTLKLYARPLADFILPVDSACGPYSFSPTDASGSNSNISSWNWTLTDSVGVLITTSTLPNPTFSLPQSFNGIATYSLQLIVTDDRSCSDTTTQNVYINPTPSADFTLSDSTCTGVNLNTLLVNNSNSNLSYNWNLDSAGISILTSTDPIPSFILNNNDTTTFFYTLSLTVTNNYGCDSTVFDSIAIHPNAIAQFNTTGPIVDCAPLLIDTSLFVANHFSGNGIYNWQLMSGSGSLLNTATGISTLNYNLLNSVDTVKVILSVSSVFGCQASIDSILVYTLPNPDPFFKLTQDTGCSVFTLALDTIGQSSGLHFWKIRDNSLNQIGATLTGINPIFPPLSSTSSTGLTRYFIEHLVYALDTNSCDSTFTDFIYVQPIAAPTIDSIIYFCAQDTISLSGTSTNNGNVGQWIWHLGGDTLFGQSVSYFNPIPGAYPVGLTTITQEGCDTTVFDTLVIHSYPKAQIWINDCGLDTVCVNQPFSFKDTSITDQYGGDLVTFNWDFNDDGSTEYATNVGSHTFFTVGIKQLRLTVESEFGCSDDTLIQVYVNAPPYTEFDITDSILCGPAQFAILESDTGLVDSSYYELHTFDYNNTKVIIQSWQTLPTNLPTLMPNYLSETTYFLAKSLFNCCGSVSVTDSIIIRTPPVADFVIIPDSGCTPLNTIIQLDGLIKGQADSAYIDFGDGTDLSLKPTLISQGSTFVYQWGQPQHTFTYGGTSDTTYIVALTVYNDCGDSTLTQPVYLQPNTVQATFNADKSTGCSPLTVNFTNYSYNASSLVWCFDWDTQDSSCTGSSSTLSNPTWVFTQSGTYTVALLVNNGCGYDTAYQQIIVYPSPNAVILSPSNVCSNDSLSFISNSNTSSGWITDYFWDFGDGDSSILINPDHLYDSSGTYLVTLTVTSSNGCRDSASQAVFLQPTPLVSFTANDVCLNDTTSFSNLTTIPSGQIIGTSWDFGDGNSSNVFNPKHVYGAPGNYTVTLIHTSDYGCIDSSQEIVLVYDLPILSFNVTMTAGDSCSAPQTYLFTNNSSNAIQYLWDFDYLNNPGINTSSLTSPSHTFSSPGKYVIGLFAENSFGCVDSLFRTILVRDGVIASNNINPQDGCGPLSVSFTDSSIYSAALDTIKSSQWHFGDGSKTLITTPPFSVSHTYNTYGVYAAYNIVTMTSGCSDSSSSTILNVYPTPSPGFTIDNVNINTRNFVNTSQLIDSNITYYWTFSDGQTSNQQNPTASFEPSTIAGDSIRACLYISNSYGCSDSICKSFWIWSTNLIVPNAFAPELDYVGDDALFLPKGHSLSQYELWIYDKWGNNVFYTDSIDPFLKSPANGWNGNDIKTGEPVPMGVYAWRIKAVFDDGTRWTGQESVYGVTKTYGTLTLIR